MLGEYAEALRLIHDAMEAARRARDVEQIAFTNFRLWQTNLLRGNWQEARRFVNDNLRMPPSPPRRQESEHGLAILDGDLVRAASIAQGLLVQYRTTAHPQGIYLTGGPLVWHYLELGRVQEARDVAVEIAAEMERTPLFTIAPLAVFVLEALARGGEHERCAALCARGESISRSLGGPEAGMTGALYGRAVLALERNDLDGAVELLEESLRRARQHGLVLQAYVLRALSRALLRRGAPDDPGRAKAALQECLTLLERMGDARKAEQVRGELSAL